MPLAKLVTANYGLRKVEMKTAVSMLRVACHLGKQHVTGPDAYQR